MNVKPREPVTPRAPHCRRERASTPLNAGNRGNPGNVATAPYLTVTVTGLNCSDAGVPSGVLPTPVA